MGTELKAGTSWGTAVPASVKALPGGNRAGTAGKTQGKDGMPVGVPSSNEAGLAAPQSAEVAAAAAASQSLEPSVRTTVAVQRASSGVSFTFDAEGGKAAFEQSNARRTLAARLGVSASKVQLTYVEEGDASSASGRRRMDDSSPLKVRAYVTTSKDVGTTALLATMRNAASDSDTLSAALNASARLLDSPMIKQRSPDGTELSYHPWHIAYTVPYEWLMAALLIALTIGFVFSGSHTQVLKPYSNPCE